MPRACMKDAGQVCRRRRGKYALPFWPGGSDLAAFFVDRSVQLKPIPRAELVQRLAADPFEQGLHQVDRVAAALAAIGAGLILCQTDDLISSRGRLGGL